MKCDDFIAADDRGYLYGDALFETVRVCPDGSIRWLDAHQRRLRRSGEALGFGEEAIEAGVQALGALSAQRPGIWRVTVSRPGVDAQGRALAFGGSGGLSVRFREYRAPARPDLGLARGFYLPEDRLAEHKTTSFLRAIEVRRRAQLQGFDDAIMTSASGEIGEASCANVIVVGAGGAATPPVRGILPGVTRAGVLRRAREVGQPIEVREIRVAELQQAREVILVSAGVGLLAAASLEGRALGDSWATNARTWLP